MATITNYTTLQTAATEYLGRDQDTTLIARIPSFIQLCEAKLNRTLFVRQMEQRSVTTLDTGTTDPEFVSLPSDFQSMRRIRLSSVSGKPCLEFRSGTQMDEIRYSAANVSGRPQFFTIMGDEIELLPTPDQNYDVEMVYRKNIPALSSNTTNWLLDLAPDAYLYGTLLEATPYLKNDERIQVWAAGFSNAIDALNNLGMTSTFNAGPLTMRVSGVAP
ncbi:hypothetical protein JQ628_11340 [Bradyrhizobium lablabi]|uniref:phage adaptor protein n=1 Tax=Bradyrhizobium lablabi TaxID=722472 RepID=UPI001BA5FFB8|nr:hypothetical protein [Bradyrhizobium lablabi]